MAYYRTCPLCGGNLDPGEPCDCQEERERENMRIERMLRTSENGQMQFNFSQGVSRVEKAVV